MTHDRQRTRSPHPIRRRPVRGRGGGSAGTGRLCAALALFALVVGALPAGGTQRLESQLGYEGSRWWDEIAEIDERFFREEKWKKGLRRTVELLDRVIRSSWREPDLHRVLAALDVQRAIFESVLGRDQAARWHVHTALNLDPSAPDRLGRYGERAAPLRGISLREEGRLPDGSRPSHRFATSGYEPVEVVRPPSTGDFANVWARREQFPEVQVEVVVGVDGRVRQPVLISTWVPPVVAHWTLERIRTADYEIRPARIDGEPIVEVETIRMEFDQASVW